ncbi:MAG: tyrosine-type recombinase/integrase, partial [Dorea sp.]|nr:tyrosine-type recombinase/integrase [Dorea sp.]
MKKPPFVVKERFFSRLAVHYFVFLYVSLCTLLQGYYKTSPKTRSSKRDIPMLDNVYTILKERQERQLELKELLEDKWKPYPGLENLVFCKENGNLIEPAVMQYYIEHIQEMIKRDGIKFAKISVHTLRHTFATRCIENGMQPQVLKSILGHSSLAMTMDLYSHVLPDTKSEEMKKISGLF